MKSEEQIGSNLRAIKYNKPMEKYIVKYYFRDTILEFVSLNTKYIFKNKSSSMSPL